MATKKTSKPSENPDPQLAAEALKGSAVLAALAMKGANPIQKTVVYILYVMNIPGILVLGIPPYTEQKQIGAFAILTLIDFVCFLNVLRHYKRLLGASSGRPSAGQQGIVDPPKERKTLQLSDFTHQHIRSILDKARGDVLVQLRSKGYPDLTDDEIRANIFHPVYKPNGKSGDCHLRIYPGLHLKMTEEEELGIVLSPRQGATGRAFSTGQALVSQRLSSASPQTGHWDATFNITPDLARIIHNDLMWIISMPLKGKNHEPVGVLNIDGLRKKVQIDPLYECLALLSGSAIIIGHVMDGN